MSQPVIKVENLSKIYRIGEIGTGSIGQDVDRWFKTKILGKEDPFLKIGEQNDRATKGKSDLVYSLKDINFEVNQGDAVGIIGRNGAGKSTLLKILSRITSPTSGRVNIKGRVASLLEVGTGFHPELTGRENIYLNGTILGMRKHEIDRKLDEIIDFSGIERYIDTPVKRYSSGMYVRLAFAVAAHLESEILIVDEVLAVGDAEFQKKCLGKMGEVNKGEGRTVLFVSHNISSILNLTNAAILLNNGKNQIFDSTQVVLDIYNKQLIPSELNVIEMRNFDNRISVDKILINGNVRNSFEVKNFENIEIIIDLNSTEPINLTVEARLFDLNSVPLALFSDGHYSGSILKIKDGKHKLKTIIELPDMINSGEILLEILLTDPGKTIYSKTEHNIKIKFDGVICQSGHKFQLNNAGFLLLKGNTNELC